MRGHAHITGHVWMSENRFLGSLLSYHCVGLRDLTWVIRLGGKRFSDSVFLPALVAKVCKTDFFLFMCVLKSMCTNMHVVPFSDMWVPVETR